MCFFFPGDLNLVTVFSEFFQKLLFLFSYLADLDICSSDIRISMARSKSC